MASSSPIDIAITVYKKPFKKMVVEEFRKLNERLDLMEKTLLKRMDESISALQEKIDSLTKTVAESGLVIADSISEVTENTAKIVDLTTNITKDIEVIKASNGVDTTSLENTVANIKTLADATKAAADTVKNAADNLKALDDQNPPASP